MTELTDRLSAQAGAELASEDAALAALALADEADPLPAADAVRSRLPEKGVTVGLHRLLGRALLAAGKADAAADVLLALAERLNQAGYWTALARVTAPLVETHPREAAPLIARARTQGGRDAVPDELLEAAHAAFPRHGLLAWRLRRPVSPGRCVARRVQPLSPAGASKTRIQTADERLVLARMRPAALKRAAAALAIRRARKPESIRRDAGLAVGTTARTAICGRDPRLVAEAS
jgi:hypothetical protein